MKDQNNKTIAPKQEQKNQRQIAYKILLSTIIDHEYVIEKEQEPNYLKIASDIKIYRANIIAVVVGKEKIGMITNYLLDDGSGKITARVFEESKAIKNVEIGDCIQVIGKIRIYNEEKYVSPEIVKKIDILWLKIRSFELKKAVKQKKDQNKEEEKEEVSIIINEKKTQKEKKEENKEIHKELSLRSIKEKTENQKNKIKEQKEENQQNNKKEDNDNNIIEDLSLPSEKIIRLIKEMDKGSGVFIEELIEKSPLDDTEKIIQKMLEHGDIFQNLPGKVKVL